MLVQFGLERHTVTVEVAGSSPVHPANSPITPENAIHENAEHGADGNALDGETR